MRPYYIFILLLLFVTGCSTKITQQIIEPKKPHSTVDEALQDATIFVSNQAVLSDSSDLKSEYLKKHFAPWDVKKAPKMDESYWGIGFINRNIGFDETRQEITATQKIKLIESMGLKSYPNTNRNAITINHTDARVLPTHKPFFLDFNKAGEGYPFDYLQNSAIYANTPIRVWHVSREGSYAYVVSGYVEGWVPIKDIAFVDESLQKELQNGDHMSVVRDGISIYDAHQNYLFSTRVGQIFPKDGSKSGFAAIRVVVSDEEKSAKIKDAFLEPSAMRAFPLEMTQKNIAQNINELLGQKYGWGGMYENRDCSSMMRDVYAPFGLYLPRNSAAQAKAWEFVDFAGLSKQEKRKKIKELAVPFLTIFWKKGHVMLYLGQKDGEIYIAHAIWGVRTYKDGKEGRHVIGKNVITTTSLGEGLIDYDRDKGDLLGSLLGMSVYGGVTLK